MGHLSDEACDVACPCKWAGKSKEEKRAAMVGKAKKYRLPFDKNNKQGNCFDGISALVVGLRSDEYIHGYNTCFGESTHRQRTVWTPKDIEYWGTFEGRCYLTVCWNHLGPSCLIRLYEAAGLDVTDAMRLGIDRQQKQWEKQHKERQTSQYKQNKANNKNKRRQEREEAKNFLSRKTTTTTKARI